jgi:nitrite reductase/ring-hydroxylating ferredoxin subunit
MTTDQDEPRWMDAGAAADLAEDRGRVVQIGARRIGVYRHRGQLYALKDICPHAGVSLAKGPVAHGTVLCVGHGWTFDLATGDIRTGPQHFSVATYPVREHAGRIQVGV